MKLTTKLWIGILALVILSPLGLILPAYFKSGSKWEIRLAGAWKAPLADYSLGPQQNSCPLNSSLGYIISGIIGVGITVLIVLFIGRKLTKKGD